jgi:hypothetical protein
VYLAILESLSQTLRSTGIEHGRGTHLSPRMTIWTIPSKASYRETAINSYSLAIEEMETLVRRLLSLPMTLTPYFASYVSEGCTHLGIRS